MKELCGKAGLRRQSMDVVRFLCILAKSSILLWDYKLPREYVAVIPFEKTYYNLVIEVREVINQFNVWF